MDRSFGFISAWYFREKRNGGVFPSYCIFPLAVALNSLLNPPEEINLVLKNINKFVC
ncbi:MAG: hypothetical protein Ct9H300mP20_02560 [Gammaproteobacteria bacterium]|nr:MAG: hypothetical protein Ct9H300mP20_02560 [Gammaproteobacteria bacterium]